MKKSNNLLIKGILFCCLLIFYFDNSKAQTFNFVGCIPKYQTLSIGGGLNRLFYCSGADTLCGSTINKLGEWDKIGWVSLGGGIDSNNLGGGVLAYANYQNNIIIGGRLFKIGGQTVNRVARFDGTFWYPMGSGLDEQLVTDGIRALTVYKGELYAAGSFRRMNGTTGYNNIARWDGSTWHKVGTGITRNGIGVEINQMVVYKNELYVGGYFDVAGDTIAYNIARWDGKTWRAVGNGGAWNGVYAMEVDTIRNLLYIGGDFNGVDTAVNARKIAMWDGVHWKSVGDPFLFNSVVMDLEMYHGYLYAGSMGLYRTIRDTTFSRWDGESWEIIYGPNSNVSSLQTYKDEIYLGGSFTNIGNDTIPFLARYYSPDSVVLSTNNTRKSSTQIILFPNPVEDVLNIQIDYPITEIIIFDLYGKVCTDFDVISSKQININRLNPGTYFMKLISHNGVINHAKFVKLE